MKKITIIYLSLLILTSTAFFITKGFSQENSTNADEKSQSKVDSRGNPIVNEVPGLPGWAQKDVAGLKDEMVKYLHIKNSEDRSANALETDHALGNFIGQAFVRQIDISDIIDLKDQQIISQACAGSAFDFLHYYENLKHGSMGENYSPTSYGPKVQDFISQYGGNIKEILSIEETNTDVTPSGAYTKTTTNTGMVNLSGYTTIWDGGSSSCDDCYDDIPIGFNFYFYEGDNPGSNTYVRVSTNGYISFYQQGGGALDGTDYTNDAITNTLDPDGYIAPWWDDMIVDDQGSDGRVDYKTEGSVGSRVFTVQWYSHTRRTGDDDDYHYYQVKLYEANDEIRLNFGTWDSDLADNATVGMEDYAGLDGDCGPDCSSSNDTKPPNNYQYVPYIGTPGLWKGTHSSDWHLAANWDDGNQPTSTTDVEIPAGTPYDPVITSHAYCHDINIFGHLTLDGSSARLHVDDDIYWESGSSANVTSVTARIYVEDDWIFRNGADVQLGGYVYFEGTSQATIYVYDDNCSFNHVRNKKENTSLSFSSVSTAPLRIDGILYLDGTSEFTCTENNEPIIHDGRISNNGGSLHLDTGTWKFIGGGTNTFASGDYFANLQISDGVVVFADDVEVKEDVDITGGSFNIGSTNLTVGGDWRNFEGPGSFIQSTSRVIFNGSATQYVDHDEDFNILEIDNYKLQITSNATVTCSNYDWTSGTLHVNQGTFEAGDLNDNGIAGNWYVGPDGTAILTNNVGYVDLLGDVVIDGGVMGVIGGDRDSYWPGDASASLEMDGGELIFQDQGIYIRPTGTFTDNFSNEPHISTTDNLRIDRSDFSPGSLVFILFGNTNTYIRMDNGYFPVLWLLKDNPSNTVDANTTLDVGNIIIAEGTLDVNGQTIYSEYLVQVASDGILKMTNSSDKIVTADVEFLNGSDANITSGNIEVKGKWKFYDGTNAQLGSGNTVTFKSGGVSHSIENDDADAELGSVVIDVDAFIYGGSSQPVRVCGDFTVNSPYEFDVQAESLIVDGTLDINDGALMTLYAGTNPGFLENNADFDLEGELDVGIGSATIHGEFDLASTGELTIDGGSFTGDKSHSTSWNTNISGAFNLSSGLFEITYNHIIFEPSCIDNITGGMIRAGYSLIADTPGVFEPSAGIVESIGLSGTNAMFWLVPGNHLHNLLINRDPSTSFSTGSAYLRIMNDLEINSGNLYSPSPYTTIYVGGDWTNNVGDAGFTEGNHSVIFFGSGLSDITTDETFYDLVIDKTSNAYNAVEITSGNTINVLNDLDILDGCLEMKDLSTLDVDNDLTIASTSGLNAAGDMYLNIFVGGDWDNNNTSYSTTYGFHPGTSSTVTFDGSSTNSLTTDCPQEDFDKLVIDKPSGQINLNDNIRVNGDLLVSNGDLVNNITGLDHVFLGDVTVTGGIIDFHSNGGTTTFEGAGNQILSALNYLNFEFNDLIVNKVNHSDEVEVIDQGIRANTLTVNGGKFLMSGEYQTIYNDIEITDWDASVILNAGSELFLGGDITVYNEGFFKTDGVPGNWAHLSKTYNSQGYGIDVLSGAYIACDWTIFSGLGINGITLHSGSEITNNSFNNCDFSSNTSGSTLLTINNNQTITIDNTFFPENYFGTAYNVAKTQNQGQVTFTNATGYFAGPAFENDPYDRIDWDGFVAGMWTGAVSNDWNDPANWEYNMKPTDNDDATIPSGTPNDPWVTASGAECKDLVIESGASLLVSTGELTIDGDLDIHGELQMNNAAGVINAENNITWHPGSTDQITNGTIYIKEVWTFLDGADAQLHWDNKVVFIPGGSYHQIKCEDANAELGSVEISVTTTIHGGSTQPVRITGNCTVNAPYEFDVQAEDLIVDGTLDIKDGALMTLYAATNPGSLINNSDFILEGELDVGIGSATINDDFQQLTSTGVLNISSGSFTESWGGYATNILGEFNLTGDGLFEINGDFYFNNSPNINVNDGLIRIAGAFHVNGANVFEPTGGTVELFNGNVDSPIRVQSDNSFFNLNIWKPAVTGTAYIDLEDIVITNNLDIISGIFSCVSGTTSYNIDIGANWTSSGSFIPGTGRVTFYGSNYSDITTDETFYDLKIDKTITSTTGVEILENLTVIVLDDLSLSHGCLNMRDNTTLDVEDGVGFGLHGGLYTTNGTGVNIFIGGNWSNGTNFTSGGNGFSPGTSTVTFDGTSLNNLYSYNTYEVFHNLSINKSSGSLTLNKNIIVNNDLIVNSGDLILVDTGESQSHRFFGDVTVNLGSVKGSYNSSSTVTLEGSSNQILTNNGSDPWDLDFYELVINKSFSKENGLKGQTATFSGAGFNAYRLTIEEGVAILGSGPAKIEQYTNINDGGTLSVGPGATFEPGFISNIVGDVNVNSGGVFEAVGSPGNEAIVSVGNAFNIESGGTVGAEYAVFEDLTIDGIHVKPGAMVNATYPFSYCSFIGDETNATFLTLNNNQILTIDGASFTNNGSATNNVAKTQDQGSITFTNATGQFSGPSYENDPYNRIEWTGFVAGMWTGAVSHDWEDPANWAYNMKPTDNDDATIPSGSTNDPWVTASGAECKNLVIQSGASLLVSTGELTVDGDLEIYGELQMDDASGLLNVNENIIWKSGSTDAITNGTINLEKYWTFEDGTQAKLGGGNTVIFDSPTPSDIYNFDADAEFGSVVINVLTTINGGSTHPVQVTGDFTVNAPYEFLTQGESLVIDGVLDINDGALMTLYAGSSPGSLENNSGFDLFGELDAGIGSATINGDFVLKPTGVLNISTGSFSVDQTSSWAALRGELNITDNGLFAVHTSLGIFSGANISMSDGIIRIDDYFETSADNIFQPTGGMVEFVGSNLTQIECSQSAGNYFHNLHVNKDAGAIAFFSDDVRINQNVHIGSGILRAYAGAQSYNMEVGGNWTNLVGNSGFQEYQGTVSFTGNSPSDITTDEVFYDMVVDKTYTAEDGVEFLSNTTVATLNDLTIADGCIEMNDNASLSVANDLIIAAGAGLNADDNNLSITVGGHWDNDNTAYGSNFGFDPGASSTVTFDGASQQNLQTECSHEDFFNVAIDKPAGETFRVYDNIHVFGDLLISSGVLYNPSALAHELWGDVTVESGGSLNLFYGSTTTLKGTGDQVMSSFDDQELKFSHLVVDKTVSKEGGKSEMVTIANDGISIGDLDIQQGTILFDGNTNEILYDPAVFVQNGGKLKVDAGNALVSHGDIIVNSGGIFEAIGTSGNEVVMQNNNTSYEILIESGGTISAEYVEFQALDKDGIEVKDGAIIDPVHPLNNCEFKGWGSAVSLLTINNSQTLTIDGAAFPVEIMGGTHNVSKTVDQGSLYFTNFSGAFSGASYEDDPHNRIDWETTGYGLDLTALLEGPFNTSEMNTTLNAGGHLPLSQPYNSSPWNYAGTESVGSIPNSDVVDWVLIELRDASDAASAGSAAVVAQQAAFLLKDGSVVALDGSSILSFDQTITQSLFAVVWHRNHLGVMSANPLVESGGTYSYDFTSGAGQAYGGSLGHKELTTGVWGMVAADGNADGQVNNTDKNVIWSVQAGSAGYLSGDFNLDVQVNNTDKNTLWVPNSGSGGQVPDGATNGFECQVPK